MRPTKSFVPFMAGRSAPYMPQSAFMNTRTCAHDAPRARTLEARARGHVPRSWSSRRARGGDDAFEPLGLLRERIDTVDRETRTEHTQEHSRVAGGPRNPERAIQIGERTRV